MSKQREALQMALEAMEDHAKQYPHMQKGYTLDAIEALRKALAEPEPKPVVWIRHENEWVGLAPKERLPINTPKPDARKPLTDEQIDALDLPPNGCTMRELVRAIERAHGIGVTHE